MGANSYVVTSMEAKRETSTSTNKHTVHNQTASGSTWSIPTNDASKFHNQSSVRVSGVMFYDDFIGYLPFIVIKCSQSEG